MRSYLGGLICFNQRRSTLNCLVRNVSDDGALLVLSGAVALPLGFSLEIAQRQRSYNATVRWQDGLRLGVSFETPRRMGSEVVSLDMARRLKQSEDDKIHLRNRIRELTEGA